MTYEQELRDIIKAWDARPEIEANRTAKEVDEWLKKKMRPAVERARMVLGLPNKRQTKPYHKR